MGKMVRGKNKGAHRVLVDQEKWGANSNTYSSPPMYYYDIEFACCDCGAIEVWTADQQKWWYEEAGGDVNTTAVRCSRCRAHVNAIKEEQKRHMEEMARREPHPNDAFFKEHKE